MKVTISVEKDEIPDTYQALRDLAKGFRGNASYRLPLEPGITSYQVAVMGPATAIELVGKAPADAVETRNLHDLRFTYTTEDDGVHLQCQTCTRSQNLGHFGTVAQVLELEKTFRTIPCKSPKKGKK